MATCSFKGWALDKTPGELPHPGIDISPANGGMRLTHLTAAEVDHYLIRHHEII